MSFLALSSLVSASTADGVANFSAYNGNPVYNQTLGIEGNGYACAEFVLHGGAFNAGVLTVDRWCHTNTGTKPFSYENTTSNHILDWKNAAQGTSLSIVGSWDSGSVAIVGSTYYLVAQNESDHAVYALTSTDKVNFTEECPGPAIPNSGSQNANSMIQYLPSMGSFFTLVQRQNGGTWDIYAYESNGLDLCNETFLGLAASNAYNPWFGLYNTTAGNPEFVMTASVPNGGNYDLHEWRGYPITNLTDVQTILAAAGTGQGAWDHGHLGDSQIFDTNLLPSGQASGFGQQCYLFYGNNDVGVALDAENRSCAQIFNVTYYANTTGPGPQPGPITPASGYGMGLLVSEIALLLVVAFFGGFALTFSDAQSARGVYLGALAIILVGILLTILVLL